MKNQGGSGALARAFAEYKAGDYESALVRLAETTVDEEDYLDLAYLLGLCYIRLERWDEALLYLEQVVTSGAVDARVSQCRLSLAYVYSITGRSKLAEYELRKLVEAGEDNPQVSASLGYACWAQGRLEEGLTWYGRALEADPDNPNALNGYGYLLACADRDLKRAVTCCRRALDADPANPAYMDSLGWAYLRLGMIEEAARQLKAAAVELPGNEEVKKHMGALMKAIHA